MDAALDVMRRNGFQGASVQDILDHAGLSTRAFYRQFRSKDDLLLAMFRTASDPDVAQVTRTAAGAPTALDAVRTWIDEMLAMAFDPRRVRRLVIFNSVARQADGYEEEEAALRSSLTAPLLGALERGSSTGRSRPLIRFPTPTPSSTWSGAWPILSDGHGPRTGPRPRTRSSGSAFPHSAWTGVPERSGTAEPRPHQVKTALSRFVTPGVP